MSVILRTLAASDRGKHRENNEDSVHAGPRVVAVADGVGGGPSGEVASDIAIQALAGLESAAVTDPPAALREAVTLANQRIRDAIEADPSLEGMGTTLTAMLAADEEIAMVHIGDSRAYAMRSSTLTQLTRDDTYVQGLVDQGVITAADARVHPQRSLVTQAINGSEIRPVFSLLTPYTGDRLLLCSDGLSDVVEPQDLATVLAGLPDIQECADELIRLALEAGAPDNVSLVLADVIEAPPPPPQPAEG